MKGCILILLFAFCYGDCRKVLPIDKSANTAFINMEAGGVRAAPNPAPAKPLPQPIQAAPSSPKTQQTPSPKPVSPNVEPMKPTPPTQVAPKPTAPNQISPKPVNPPPSNPITTPGPGSVKQLITFYDSQGKASLIRPYSYSQAVKQG